VEPFKNRITKRLKDLEEKEFIKSNKKNIEKVQNLIEEVKAL